MDYEAVIKELEAKRQDLLNKANSLKGAIDVLRAERILNDNNIQIEKQEPTPELKTQVDEVNPNVTLRSRIISLFKRENRFLHIREINQLITYEDQELLKDEKVYDKIRSTISNLKTRGLLVPYKVGSSNLNTFWGSGRWLDETSTPKKEHMYNEEILNSGSSVDDDFGI